MLENGSLDSATTSGVGVENVVRERCRTAALRRAFLGQLKRKPTTAEVTALNRAVRLTVRAEAAALDPGTSLDQLVRIDGAAHRARAAWTRLVGAKQKSKPPSLAEYLSENPA